MLTVTLLAMTAPMRTTCAGKLYGSWTPAQFVAAALLLLSRPSMAVKDPICRLPVVEISLVTMKFVFREAAIVKFVLLSVSGPVNARVEPSLVNTPFSIVRPGVWPTTAVVCEFSDGALIVVPGKLPVVATPPATT